ncbi:LamG-like jellyroll fold domain-containing protein [Glycomyces sp. MUSA5-2]|uniref:LamG-like jellyroll fold domain-containing protein n=1 Tax=Glycomyces sp. MUSA5-2 TaxID=2053002 RepID=UPI0030080BBE
MTDQRSEFGTVVALPSGGLKAQIGVEPIQALDESGEWAPIDTTLEIASDGSVRPVNITEEVAFSAGGAAPLATVDYGSAGVFALAWPGELPEPVLDGPQAVYADVMAGVDLVVEATAQGFRYDLVVADAEAAANPDLEAIVFDVEATGVEVAESASGSVEVSVDGQAEMASGEALMWESPAGSDGTATVPDLTLITDTPTDPDQEVAPVDVALESADLVLRPDLELLRGADTRYPVVIDPQWDGGIQDNLWGLVNTKYPDSTFYRGKNTSGDYFMSNTSTYGNAGAGQTCDSWSELTCYSSTYDMRSMFRMDTDTITQNDYRVPSKGVFKIVQRHSASCSNGAARIYRTGGYNADDTWNTQPSWNEYVAISSANNGALCDGSAYVSFNVTSMVQMAEDNEWANLTLGLRAPDESPSPDLLQWNRFDSYTAVLEITYDVIPYTVTKLQLNGASCTAVSADTPWITDRTPELSGLVRSSDATVKWTMQVKESGSNETPFYEYTSGALTSNYRQSRTVPTSPVLGDGVYYWHAKGISATNSSLTSSWSSPCRFKLDGTKPSTPSVTPGAEAPYAVGDTLSLTLQSTDSTVNGVSSGIARFEYSWQTNTYDQSLASTGTATLTRANLTAGRHVLYVRAVDAAGNASDAKTYTFFAGNDIPATPMAAWRFEGDTADDTGEGHHLTLAAGDAVAYTTDRDGRPNSALALDGATCLHTGDGVIFTSGAYSLTAWVRLDTVDNTTERPLAQIGDSGAGFQVWYSASANLWYFSVLDADQNWYSIGAAPTAALGEWEHIAATYDPDAQITRLYLGGTLVAERTAAFTPWNAASDFGVGCKPDASATTAVNGAIDQVGVWQGLLTDAQIQAAMTDLPGASVQADWTFRDDGTDESGHGRNLDTDGLTVGSDPYHRPSGSVELDNSTCLEYPEPVVSTDRSVTIASWVKFDISGESDTIAAIAGVNNAAIVLRKLTSDQIQLRITSSDNLEDGTATAPTVYSRTTAADAPLSPGEWYHVAGTYDAAAGTMSLYLNGVLASTRTVPVDLWRAEGPTLIGCNGRTSDGYRTGHLKGALHGLSLWRGAVDAAQIAGLMGNPPAEIAAWWDFNSFQSDPEIPVDPTADVSGNGHGLTFSETVDPYTIGWNSELDNALGFDGTAFAQTSGQVIDTDASFTVATWVRADSLAADGVAVSIAGESRGMITLKYSAANAAWQFAAPPTSEYGWRTAGFAATPVADDYTFLVGVFDLLKNELQLYVDGKPVATKSDVVLPASTAPVVIGAEGNADGTIRNGLIGAVDDTVIWQGALDCREIATIVDPQLPEEVC